jgi:hypothetical protein
MSRSLLSIAAAALLVSGCASTPTTGGASAPPSAASAAASSTDSPAGAVPLADAVFIASRKTKRFYSVNCSAVKLIAPEDAIGFASRNAAEKAGFKRDGDFCPAS